jgi:uncharacterized protein
MGLDKSVDTFDYPVIDTDCHIFDPPEIFTEHMASDDLARLRELVSPESPTIGPVVHGSVLVNRGSSYRMHMDWADAGLTNLGDPGYIFPGASDPEIRLKCMDEEGIDAGIVRNTIVPHLGMFVLKDQEMVNQVCRAYNDWVHEFCSADLDRLLPEAALPFGDVDATIKEIERTAAMRFKSTCISGSTSAPAPLSDDRWDPIWARLEELGWPLCIHAGFTPEVDSSARWILGEGKLEGSSAGAYFNMNLVLNFVLDNMVTMGEVTLGGMCDKFPSLNIYFIESGHSWAGETIYRLDKVFDCPFEEYWPNGVKATTRPSEIFQRQLFVPFEGGDRWMAPIFDTMQDNLVWASDIPHWDADGPWEGAGALRALGVSPEVERKVMGQNAARLLNIPYEKRVGTSH